MITMVHKTIFVRGSKMISRAGRFRQIKRFQQRSANEYSSYGE